jgi:hypothetical protein
MGIVVRVDVDKPYGRKTIFGKVFSKLKEDYWFPTITSLGYLKATAEFIQYCNDNNVRAHFYFRHSTLPSKKIRQLLISGNHEVGFHAENTRSFETFQEEYQRFSSKLPNLQITSFSKHGSGDIKIGRHHYYPYEPSLYKDWAAKMNIGFSYGNEICDSEDDFNHVIDFYPKMFWIHQDYRGTAFNTLEEVVSLAKELTVPVIIHPSNFIAEPFVRSEFKRLVTLANLEKIDWIIK